MPGLHSRPCHRQCRKRGDAAACGQLLHRPGNDHLQIPLRLHEAAHHAERAEQDAIHSVSMPGMIVSYRAFARAHGRMLQFH